VTATGSAATAAAEIPALAFAVRDAEPEPTAIVPTLAFRLAIATESAREIRSLSLNVQVRIATTRRGYDAPTQARLLDLFGEPARWGATLRSLLWTQATLVVPPFRGETVATLRVPCTYDFEIVAAKYLDALRDGVVPLELLFSGTIFYAGDGGALRTARIPWDREAAWSLPIDVWRATMDRWFPGSAWLRLSRDAFDRLYAYRARRALPTWDDTIAALLDEAER